MDNRVKTQFIYRLQNGINIVLLKNNYRYDESSVLECDDETLARILRTDDGWKTINGAHVLIGKAGRIKAGAGGKFNGKRFGMNFNDYDKPKAKNGKRLIRVHKPLKVKATAPVGQNAQELRKLTQKIQKRGDVTRELKLLPVGTKLKLVYSGNVYHLKKLANGDFKVTLNGKRIKNWGAWDVSHMGGDEEGLTTQKLWVIGLPRKYKPLVKTAKHDKIDGANLVAQKKLDNLKEKLRGWHNELNEHFKKVTERQGFRGLPKLVSKEEFSKIAQDTGIVMYRGYYAKEAGTADGYRKEFHSGDWYTDCNGGAVYGLGMYTAAAVNDFMGLPLKDDQTRAYRTARIYADSINPKIASRIECMTLSDAKIIKTTGRSDKTIENLWIKTYQQANNCSREKAELECNKRENRGILAAELGFDAIRVDFGDGENYMVVLNRTKCVVYKDGADNAEVDL